MESCWKKNQARGLGRQVRDPRKRLTDENVSRRKIPTITGTAHEIGKVNPLEREEKKEERSRSR